MPAMIKDKYGNAIYEGEPGYANALSEQKKFLEQLDAKLGSTPQQNVSTPTVQPTPLGGAFSTPTISPIENISKTLLTPKEETVPQYQQDSPFDYLSKNIFTPTANALSAGAKGIGSFASDVGQGIKQTVSDVGNFADRNRVGLGGFATAIGAGLARRDPSEALANYNRAIIQNKQQAQEEEKFKMATDGNHPYNQQFRELFAKMLPDVTAKFGDRFNSMTVQNFKDAGMGDLPVLIEKQIEISKNDPNSAISKRTRDMASSQYGIQIKPDVSANEVPRYIEALKTQNEMANKREEIGIKKGKLEVETGKALSDKENKENLLKIKQAEESRNQQMFEPQLTEQQAKAKIATETQQDVIARTQAESQKEQYLFKSMDYNSDLSKNTRKSFLETYPKYKYLISKNMSDADIKEIETKVIPNLVKEEKSNISAEKRTRMQTNAQIQAQTIRDKNANYRASLVNQLGKQRLSETARHNLATEDINRKKISEKYADTYISEGDLNNQGLTKPAILKKLESGSGAKELIRNANSIMNNIDNLKPTDALGLTELSGQLQSLYTNMGLDVKQNKALGAYDQGVRDLLSEMAVNPNSVKAYAKKKFLKGQYKAVIDSVNSAYKAKSIQQKWDERIGSPVDYTLKLNRAVIDNDPEAMQEFSDLGYETDDLLKAYKNSMPLKRKGE